MTRGIDLIENLRGDDYGRAAEIAGLPMGYWRLGSAEGMPRKASQRWLVRYINYAEDSPQTLDLLLDYQDIFGRRLLQTASALKRDLSSLRKSGFVVMYGQGVGDS